MHATARAFMHAAAARMIPAARLLATVQCLLLVGRHQRVALLHGLLANFLRLFMLLLGRQRGVRADGFNL